MANNKRVFVPVFKDSIKSLRGKDGKSHTTVSMKIDGEKKYGELFFNDSDLKQSQKNKNLMLLGLDADRSYNVGFKDGTYSNWEYEKMTGQQISEANKAYVADRQAEKDSFQSKLDAGIAKAAQEAAAEPYTFTDGTNVYTLEELRNYRSGVIDTFDWHTMDFDEVEEIEHETGLDVVERVLSHEMGQYFGDMTSKEKGQLIEMCDEAYIHRKSLAEGRLGVLMNLEGDMACSGYHIGWDSVDTIEKQTEKESVKATEQEPEKQENVFTKRDWNWRSLDCYSFKIPEGVTRIDDYAFCIPMDQHDYIPSDITIPNSVTEIGSNAFSGCRFAEIEIPDSVTSIGDFAFDGCVFLEDIKLPKGLTKIEDGLFCGCESLKSIEIPDGVTEIGDNAFMDCERLESIEIPDSVASIGADAFLNCKRLESVTMPEDIVIDYESFDGCSNLKMVTFRGNVPDYISQYQESYFESNPAIMTMKPENKVLESVTAMEPKKISDEMSEKMTDTLAEKLSEKMAKQSSEKGNSVTSSKKDVDKAVVQIKESSIKPLPNHPGRSYASIGLNSEHGTYGNIYFSDNSLKTPRSNPNVRLLYLNPDKEYNVAFSNPDTDKWEYHNMTGREISDGNRAYLKERGLVKDAVTERPLPDIADSMDMLQSDTQFEG